MASVHQRYRIIEKIDAGGMAEIYRGEAVSIDGFARTVAIKRILPSMCTDAKFVSMFLDEARLSMQLTHANIVQIFDIGKADDTYFVVMELIDGANLRRLMQRIVDSGGSFPVALACYITMETCRGLAYAHEKAGSDGKALGIVHRDVSPPNVLISKQGEVKLTDFGLAKAASHATHTDAGVIKGKFAYLSPEVVDGKEVDLRADVYAAGIMLWEMLCGRKLFAGKTDMETVELVRKGDVDKPSRRTELDDELDRIVLKALARNPKRRYQTARAFEQAIAGFLFKHNLRVTATDMSEWMRGFESDGEGEVPFDVIDILRAEFEEAAHAGRVDPHIGQRPLGPTDLATRGGAMLPIGDLLGKLAQLPLEDLAGDRDAAPAPVPLADRLDAPETLPEVRGESADGGGGAGKWIAVAAVVALLAAGVAAWQLGLLPLPLNLGGRNGNSWLRGMRSRSERAMQFFLDTADIAEIEQAHAWGILDGVTTNPSLVAKTGRRFDDVKRDILALVKGPVSLEVTATDVAGMMEEARALAAEGSQVVVKIPLTQDGIAAVVQCRELGIKTNVTLCFSANQALLAAKAGATYISPFVGRLDDIGHNGMQLVQEILEVYEMRYETQVLAASLRHPLHVLEAARLGAHVGTMPYSTMQQLFKHPMTDLGLQRFLADWQKVPA